MEATVQKSLAASMKKLSSCVRGEKELDIWTKHRPKQRLKGRGSKVRRCPPPTGHVQEPVGIRAYQAQLDRERKKREAMRVQKNAERAAMRNHYRRKYKLTPDAEDAGRLRATGGKVSLPQELLRLVQPEAREEGSSLLGTFQNLNIGLSAGSKRDCNSTTHSCVVM